MMESAEIKYTRKSNSERPSQIIFSSSPLKNTHQASGGPSSVQNSYGLLRHVFQWSTPDIMNDNLLVGQVKTIPTRFGSLSEYFTSFRWPLLEEVRAQLKQSLELCGEAPYATIAHIEEYNIGGSVSESFISLKVFIGQERRPQKNIIQVKFKPKDLLLLSSVPACSCFEGLGSSREWNLMAFVAKAEEDDMETFEFESSSLKIVVDRCRALDAYEDLMDDKRNWCATYLLSLATSCRIWNALNPADTKKSIFPIIEKSLNYHPDQNSRRQYDTPFMRWLKQTIAGYCSSVCCLNESQTQAVVNVVCDVKTGLDPGVRMIQGPPGTGKTSTIVTLLSVAASTNMKCLVACPTNTAIAEVALRYLQMLEVPGKIQFGEFCKSPAFDIEGSADTTTMYKILKRGDVIVVGNAERLPLQGKLKEIYLRNRVQLIQTAYDSWREVASSLYSFILSIESRYEEEQAREDVHPVQHTSHLEFARSHMEEPMKKLREHGNTLIEELPIHQAEEFSEASKLGEKLLRSILKPTISEDFFNWFASSESKLELVNRLQKCLVLKYECLSSIESIEKLCMKSSSLVFCTVSTAGRDCMKHAVPFDCLIIDEAAQLVEAETGIAACLPGLNHVILVGDHQQLPATVISKMAVDSGYGRSLFERMISLEHPCHLLNTQYRMHPKISLFPSSRFYEGRLRNGDNVRTDSYRQYDQLLYGSYAFIDVSDGAEQTGHDGKSKRNSVEAAVVTTIINMLCEATKRNKIQNLTVGIITPYSSQKDQLKTCLEGQEMEPLIVDVNSVDGFQGQERDIIIISTVRANKHGAIGFLDDYRRLNVAITRARYCLWIVGCCETLQARHNIWTDLLKDAADRGLCRRAADEDKVAQAIIKLQKDLNVYANLLRPDSALFTNMLWKVLFSHDFKNSFPRIKQTEKKDKILTRICRLSSGKHFSQYKMDCVTETEQTKGIIEVDVVADLCLVWSIHIEQDVKATQIIKIWDIVDRPNLYKLIKRLQAAFRVYSDEYIERCKIRRQGRDKKLTVPETWEDHQDFVWLKPHGSSAQVAGATDQSSMSGGKSLSASLEESSVNESLLLMKFYAMSSGIVNNLLTAQDGSDVNLPFEVNKEETMIMKYPSSCFILGRSGTGKTTVLVTKLLRREQQFHISLDGFNSANRTDLASKGHIKQIFVTLSPLLCYDIKQQIANVQRTLSMAAESTSTHVSSNMDYELFLDGDDEDKIMGFLPNSFMDVPCTHYPMVLTYQKFLIMLSNSVPCPFFKDDARSSFQSRKIDFDRFNSDYWPHLNSSLRKKLDPSTVFTEIMSVIKGSLQAVKSPKGILSKESYCLSKSGAEQLSMKQREDVYDLYLQYEKQKMETNCYDMADMVKHTYKQLCQGEYHGDSIDFVYIDEVQDFTQAQLSLFSFVCTNTKEGYIFAGDTAQTIARGVKFRFQEGRSLFYTEFGESADKSENGVEMVAATVTRKEFKPELFHLSHNFRTHMGVVNMANSIVHLLYHFFPQSIDKLEPETSLVGGPLPALLKARREDLEKVMHNMGAQQVVLVRDEAQKTQLQEQIGKSGIILTISGCKGLEFQDVLLYNFFSGSVMGNNWRVLYEYLFQKGLIITTDDPAKTMYRTFDMTKHNLLCCELKHLYVAVTRARQHLWIYEENSEHCKPMLDYWLSHELIETKSIDESFLFSVTPSNTPDDWRKIGSKLFNRQYYGDAMLCFERAGDQKHFELAKAASLQQNGEKQLSSNKKEAKEKLGEAAQLFLALERAQKAAECYIKIQDFQKAGDIYIENCKPPKFEDAGDCFLEGKRWLQAAQAYFNGKCLKKCLDACLKGKDLEDGLSFIKEWDKQPFADDFETGHKADVDEYLQECARIYHQQQNVTGMMVFVNAFSSIGMKRTFLRARDYFEELMKIEEAENNYIQAATLAELKGDLLHAANLLEKAGDYDSAVNKVLLLIHRDGLWGQQNKGWPLRATHRSRELLPRVEELAALANDCVRHEVQIGVLLLFQELESPQDIKHLLSNVQSLSSMRVKLLTAWKAMDAFLRVLKEVEYANVQRLHPTTKTLDRDSLLLNILSVWIDWQDMILHCKRAISGKDRKREAAPKKAISGKDRLGEDATKSAQDDHARELCYEFFGITHAEDSNVCFVHDLEAYWFKSNRKGKSPMRIPTKEFAKLAVKFWDEQLSEQNKAITDMCNLQAQLPALLRPQIRKTEDMYHVQKLREASSIAAVLDKIAGETIDKCGTRCTLEETGRLQLIYPFLSEAWRKEKENASSFKKSVMFWKNPARQPSDLCVECYLSDLCVENYFELSKVFNKSDWKKDRGYISPLVFVALLEKVAVMACACETLLHEMFLPMTLAFDFLCGKVQEDLYQRILQSEKVTWEYDIIESIKDVALQLVRQPAHLNEWFTHVHGNQKTDFPPTVLRLTTLLLMICLNSRDAKIRNKLVIQLQQIFNYEAPVLKYLPQSYTKELRKACLVIFQMKGDINDESMKHLKHALAKALMSLGDSLVVTKRCRNEYCCKPQDGIMVVEMNDKTDISMKLAALAGLSTSTYLENWKIQNYAQIPPSFVPARETEEAARNSSTEKDTYNAYLNKEAFHLKVTVDSFVQRLADSIPSLNNDNLLSEFDAAQKTLQLHIHHLDPSHKKHTEYDLEWLKETVNLVQKTYNDMEHKAEIEVKKLVGDSLLEAGADDEEAEEKGKTSSIADQDDATEIAGVIDKTSKKGIEHSSTRSASVNQAGSSKAKHRKSKQRSEQKSKR